MPKRKKTVLRINTDTDIETGEITKESYSYSQNIDVDSRFFKTYKEAELILFELPDRQRKILDYLLFRIDFDTNQIDVRTTEKQEIASKLKCSVNAVNKKIKKLVQYGILSKERQSVYTANPYLFGYGYANNIDKIRGNCDFLPSHVLTNIKKDKINLAKRSYNSFKKVVNG